MSYSKRPKLENLPVGSKGIQCKCGKFLETMEEIRKHWNLGHFDIKINLDVKQWRCNNENRQ